MGNARPLEKMWGFLALQVMFVVKLKNRQRPFVGDCVNYSGLFSANPGGVSTCFKCLFGFQCVVFCPCIVYCI